MELKKFMFICRAACILCCFSTKTPSWAQVVSGRESDSAALNKKGNFSISAYADIYAGYLFSKPATRQAPYFVSSARLQELNINLAYVDMNYKSERLRARIVPAFGTYMAANYAAEPAGMRNLLEASAGFRLFRHKNIWLDAGILSSPYTNENAISAQQLMYTRSLAPEYSPYYLSGVKLSAPLSPKVSLSLYLVNGWQEIQDRNDGKSIGTQLEYRPNPDHTFTWNTYFGDERNAQVPENRKRLFSDVYWVWNPETGPWKASACLFAGLQVQKFAPRTYGEPTWWQANIIASRELTKKLSMAGRIEYFWDVFSTMIRPVAGREGFTAGSAGLCMNIKADDHALFRIEGRRFFGVTGRYKEPLRWSDTWLCGNMSVWF